MAAGSSSSVTRLDHGCDAARADRLRWLDPGCELGEQRGGDGHDLRRGAVVHRQRPVDPAAGHVRLQHRVPRCRSGRRPALGEIADHREGSARAAPHQHPPVHFGQFLGLVDHDVPVGPVPVRGSAFGEFTGVALDEAVREVLGVEQVRGEQVVLVVHRVLAVDQQVQHAGGVLGLGLPLPLGGSGRRACRGPAGRPARRAAARPTPSRPRRRRATAPRRRPPRAAARETCTAVPAVSPVSGSARVRRARR